MSSSKKIDIICVIAAIAALILTLLFMNGEAFGIKNVIDEDAEENSDSVYFTKNDMNGSWNTAVATKILLKKEKVKISGAGAVTKDNDVVINSGGHYVLSGSLTDGSIVVDTKSSAKVWILLDGADINCNDDACIKVKNADKVFLTLAKDSVNRLTSGETYNEETLADGTDGAIFSHDDMTINGSGSLEVTALYKHGIAVNDALVITGGEITVSAVSGAVHANENLRICNASLNLSSSGKGIVINDAEGYFYYESGRINMTVSDDGINTAGNVSMTGGEINISAGDDGIHSLKEILISGGRLSILRCYEGLEAPVIKISDGEVSVFPEGDGVSAKHKTIEGETEAEKIPCEFTLDGGSLTIINTDGKADGIDSDGNVTINAGVLRICLNGNGSNNAIEFDSENGGSFFINGGDILVTGGAAKAEEPSSASGQKYIFKKLRMVPAGTTITLKDADGKTISEYTPEAAFSNLLISLPDLNGSEEFRLYIGGEI